MQHSIKKLFRNPVIKKFVAAILLAVFAFSNTPKKVLHDLIANHKDVTFKHNGSTSQEITAWGFKCNCDQLVTDSPFTEHSQQFNFTISRAFRQDAGLIPYCFCCSAYFFFSLRGPPVNA